MTAVTRLFTAEEFDAYAQSHRHCELIRGEVRDLSPTGGLHGKITSRLQVRIGLFVEDHQLGDVFAAETGFRLDDDGLPSVRAPDVAFVASARTAAANTSSFPKIAPDLVVETLSPSDRMTEVMEKVQWWLEHGVRLVWVVDPVNQFVSVYEPGGSSRIFKLGDTLTAGDVLPGFGLALAELFKK